RGPLTLNQRSADLLAVGTHRFGPEPDASQSLQPFGRPLERQFGPSFGHPRLQFGTQDLVGIQAEDGVGRGPALFTRWTPVVRPLKRGRAAHTHRLPCT